MEHPGRHVAAAEEALKRFLRFCNEMAALNAEQVVQQTARAQRAQDQLDTALQACIVGGGGFSFFGNRTHRLLRVFLDLLAAYARQSLVEDLNLAVQQFFKSLCGKLEERQRDLSFCRQRLRHLQTSLEMGGGADDATTMVSNLELSPNSPLPSTDSFWEAIRQSATTRVVLPGGEKDLEQAARRFLANLERAQWGNLDQVLQDQVLGPLGGLHRICSTSNDLVRSLAVPLLEQAVHFLDTCLPVTDVAQVEFELAAAREESVAAQAETYFRSAAPLVVGGKECNENGFLLIPARDVGKAYGEAVTAALPGLQVVRVPGQADLMFCREQPPLSIEDLERILRPCRTAYEDLISIPQVSPHARFDILDWLPLAP